MAKWVVSAKSADFEEIGKKFHIDPVIARIIRKLDNFQDSLLNINQYEKEYEDSISDSLDV